MISKRQLPELRAFAQAELTLPMRSAPELAALVVPNGNSARPIHQWFKYKEAFSADLVQHVIDELLGDGSLPSKIRLLDPFCGVGTSLVSAQIVDSTHEIASVGIECNPFSAFVAKTKLAWSSIDPSRLRAFATAILSQRIKTTGSLPSLSSIRTGRCISRHMATQILGLRSQIETLPRSPERDALLVGLAACIEPVSKVRRDGRALRIVDKPRSRLRHLLAERWESMVTDVESMSRLKTARTPGEIICGDGRRPSSVGIANGSIDVILTSPPYPNNIDYNEVYKLELWLLGFASSADSFLRLRRQTFRSHPTCSAAGTEPDYDRIFSTLLEAGPFADLLGKVTRRVRALDKRSARGRSKVLVGYAYDTWLTLKSHAAALRSGGRGIYVVGNSLHGSSTSRPYLVPTDLMFCCLGQMVGLEVQSVNIARPLSRRLSGNHFLRDSIVVLRKP